MLRIAIPSLPLLAFLLFTSTVLSQDAPRGACVLSDRSWCFPPSSGPRGDKCWCLIDGNWEAGTQN